MLALSLIQTLPGQNGRRFGPVENVPFNQSACPPPPDYNREEHWLALPWRPDVCDTVSTDMQRHSTGETRDDVDIFWIHPTTFLRNPVGNYYWNAPVPYDSIDQITQRGSMLYQASAFNASGRVFAPKYRQAHVYSFFTKQWKDKRAALDTAYADVKRAFLHYMQNWNEGRPVIIASHSQGSWHGACLVAEMFDRGPYKDQLVAAYLVGMPIPRDSFPHLPVCSFPEQTGCVISWSTYARGYRPDTIAWEKTVAVNPISWRNDEEYVPRKQNPGGMLWKFGKIHPKVCDAQLMQGILWIKKPVFFGNFLFTWKNYHIADYNLFFLSIRNNALLRVNSYFSSIKSEP